MEQYIQWITENKDAVVQAIGYFYLLATAVAALTPSDKDDTWLDKIGTIADRFGLKLKGK